MNRIRVTIRPNPDDPADDLRLAARVRHDLWAHLPILFYPDERTNGTRRDEARNAYFEFTTDAPADVESVLREQRYDDRVTVQVVEENVGEACQNCGNIPGPVLPTVCPTCGHRDISPCPHCSEEVPRQEYCPVAGELFVCPRCKGRVRMLVNPDLVRPNGSLNEPVVMVEKAEAAAHGNHR